MALREGLRPEGLSCSQFAFYSLTVTRGKLQRNTENGKADTRSPPNTEIAEVLGSKYLFRGFGGKAFDNSNIGKQFGRKIMARLEIGGGVVGDPDFAGGVFGDEDFQRQIQRHIG
jgi:hypothetical protein